MRARKYNAKTGKNYVSPVCLSIADSRILEDGLAQVHIWVATAVNYTTKVDYAVAKGFWQGFSKNFQKYFDKKYYKQLWEEVFKYKRIRPNTYIAHLETTQIREIWHDRHQMTH